MEDAASLARQATSDDPGVGLLAARALRRLAEQLEAVQVRRARALGLSWREIAGALGLSKQAVHHKYAAVLDEGDAP